MMITEIGIVSGGILSLLEESGRPISIDEIESHLRAPRSVIFMSVGWLAREGYVHLIHIEDRYVISQKPIEQSTCLLTEELSDYVL